MNIPRIDHAIINFFRKIYIVSARSALFVVFFWFGLLKVLGLSPASPMVHALFDKTIPYVSFDTFIIAFGLFEVLIGILFLIPKATRLAIPLLFMHMIMTMLPLFVLPHMVWTAWFVPTLEGQYIVKNLVLIAAALGIASQMVPLHQTRTTR